MRFPVLIFTLSLLLPAALGAQGAASASAASAPAASAPAASDPAASAPAASDPAVSDPAVEAPTTAATATVPSPEVKQAAAIQALLEEADSLYGSRGAKGRDKAKAAIAKAHEVLALDPDNYEAQWRIARAAYWIADGTEDSKAKAKWGKIGWDAGKAGLKVKPGAIEAQMWGAASLGHYAKGSGIMKAVWDGLGKEYEQWVRKAMKIDPRYAQAAPPRALGRYYFTLPGIAGGDNNKAIKYLEESKKLFPASLRTRAWLAEAYLEGDETEKAKAELDYCVSADLKQGDHSDNLRMQPQCKKLQAKL